MGSNAEDHELVALAKSFTEPTQTSNSDDSIFTISTDQAKFENLKKRLQEREGAEDKQKKKKGKKKTGNDEGQTEFQRLCRETISDDFLDRITCYAYATIETKTADSHNKINGFFITSTNPRFFPEERLYLDLVCAERGQGSHLINAVVAFAKRKGFTGVSLNASSFGLSKGTLSPYDMRQCLITLYANFGFRLGYNSTQKANQINWDLVVAQMTGVDACLVEKKVIITQVEESPNLNGTVTVHHGKEKSDVAYFTATTKENMKRATVQGLKDIGNTQIACYTFQPNEELRQEFSNLSFVDLAGPLLKALQDAIDSGTKNAVEIYIDRSRLGYAILNNQSPTIAELQIAISNFAKRLDIDTVSLEGTEKGWEGNTERVKLELDDYTVENFYFKEKAEEKKLSDLGKIFRMATLPSAIKSCADSEYEHILTLLKGDNCGILAQFAMQTTDGIPMDLAFNGKASKGEGFSVTTGQPTRKHRVLLDSATRLKFVEPILAVMKAALQKNVSNIFTYKGKSKGYPSNGDQFILKKSERGNNKFKMTMNFEAFKLYPKEESDATTFLEMEEYRGIVPFLVNCLEFSCDGVEKATKSNQEKFSAIVRFFCMLTDAYTQADAVDLEEKGGCWNQEYVTRADGTRTLTHSFEKGQKVCLAGSGNNVQGKVFEVTGINMVKDNKTKEYIIKDIFVERGGTTIPKTPKTVSHHQSVHDMGGIPKLKKQMMFKEDDKKQATSTVYSAQCLLEAELGELNMMWALYKTSEQVNQQWTQQWVANLIDDLFEDIRSEIKGKISDVDIDLLFRLFKRGIRGIQEQNACFDDVDLNKPIEVNGASWKNFTSVKRNYKHWYFTDALECKEEDENSRQHFEFCRHLLYTIPFKDPFIPYNPGKKMSSLEWEYRLTKVSEDGEFNFAYASETKQKFPDEENVLFVKEGTNVIIPTQNIPETKNVFVYTRSCALAQALQHEAYAAFSNCNLNGVELSVENVIKSDSTLNSRYALIPNRFATSFWVDVSTGEPNWKAVKKELTYTTKNTYVDVWGTSAAFTLRKKTPYFWIHVNPKEFPLSVVEFENPAAPVKEKNDNQGFDEDDPNENEQNSDIEDEESEENDDNTTNNPKTPKSPDDKTLLHIEGLTLPEKGSKTWRAPIFSNVSYTAVKTDVLFKTDSTGKEFIDLLVNILSSSRAQKKKALSTFAGVTKGNMKLDDLNEYTHCDDVEVALQLFQSMNFKRFPVKREEEDLSFFEWSKTMTHPIKVLQMSEVLSLDKFKQYAPETNSFTDEVSTDLLFELEEDTQSDINWKVWEFLSGWGVQKLSKEGYLVGLNSPMERPISKSEHRWRIKRSNPSWDPGLTIYSPSDAPNDQSFGHVCAVFLGESVATNVLETLTPHMYGIRINSFEDPIRIPYVWYDPEIIQSKKIKKVQNLKSNDYIKVRNYFLPKLVNSKTPTAFNNFYPRGNREIFFENSRYFATFTQPTLQKVPYIQAVESLYLKLLDNKSKEPYEPIRKELINNVNIPLTMGEPVELKAGEKEFKITPEMKFGTVKPQSAINLSAVTSVEFKNGNKNLSISDVVEDCYEGRKLTMILTVDGVKKQYVFENPQKTEKEEYKKPEKGETVIRENEHLILCVLPEATYCSKEIDSILPQCILLFHQHIVIYHKMKPLSEVDENKISLKSFKEFAGTCAKIFSNSNCILTTVSKELLCYTENSNGTFSFAIDAFNYLRWFQDPESIKKTETPSIIDRARMWDFRIYNCENMIVFDSRIGLEDSVCQPVYKLQSIKMKACQLNTCFVFMFLEHATGTNIEELFDATLIASGTRLSVMYEVPGEWLSLGKDEIDDRKEFREGNTEKSDTEDTLKIGKQPKEQECFTVQNTSKVLDVSGGLPKHWAMWTPGLLNMHGMVKGAFNHDTDGTTLIEDLSEINSRLQIVSRDRIERYSPWVILPTLSFNGQSDAVSEYPSEWSEDVDSPRFYPNLGAPGIASDTVRHLDPNKIIEEQEILKYAFTVGEVLAYGVIAALCKRPTLNGKKIIDEHTFSEKTNEQTTELVDVLKNCMGKSPEKVEWWNNPYFKQKAADFYDDNKFLHPYTSVLGWLTSDIIGRDAKQTILARLDSITMNQEAPPKIIDSNKYFNYYEEKKGGKKFLDGDIKFALTNTNNAPEVSLQGYEGCYYENKEITKKNDNIKIPIPKGETIQVHVKDKFEFIKNKAEKTIKKKRKNIGKYTMRTHVHEAEPVRIMQPAWKGQDPVSFPIGEKKQKEALHGRRTIWEGSEKQDNIKEVENAEENPESAKQFLYRYPLISDAITRIIDQIKNAASQTNVEMKENQPLDAFISKYINRIDIEKKEGIWKSQNARGTKDINLYTIETKLIDEIKKGNITEFQAAFEAVKKEYNPSEEEDIQENKSNANSTKKGNSTASANESDSDSDDEESSDESETESEAEEETIIETVRDVFEKTYASHYEQAIGAVGVTQGLPLTASGTYRVNNFRMLSEDAKKWFTAAFVVLFSGKSDDTEEKEEKEEKKGSSLEDIVVTAKSDDHAHEYQFRLLMLSYMFNRDFFQVLLQSMSTSWLKEKIITSTRNTTYQQYGDTAFYLKATLNKKKWKPEIINGTQGVTCIAKKPTIVFQYGPPLSDFTDEEWIEEIYIPDSQDSNVFTMSKSNYEAEIKTHWGKVLFQGTIPVAISNIRFTTNMVAMVFKTPYINDPNINALNRTETVTIYKINQSNDFANYVERMNKETHKETIRFVVYSTLDDGPLFTTDDEIKEFDVSDSDLRKMENLQSLGFDFIDLESDPSDSEDSESQNQKLSPELKPVDDKQPNSGNKIEKLKPENAKLKAKGDTNTETIKVLKLQTQLLRTQCTTEKKILQLDKKKLTADLRKQKKALKEAKQELKEAKTQNDPAKRKSKKSRTRQAKRTEKKIAALQRQSATLTSEILTKNKEFEAAKRSLKLLENKFDLANLIAIKTTKTPNKDLRIEDIRICAYIYREANVELPEKLKTEATTLGLIITAGDKLEDITFDEPGRMDSAYERTCPEATDFALKKNGQKIATTMYAEPGYMSGNTVPRMFFAGLKKQSKAHMSFESWSPTDDDEQFTTAVYATSKLGYTKEVIRVTESFVQPEPSLGKYLGL